MRYFLSIFTPETYRRYSQLEKKISAHPDTAKNECKLAKPGDLLLSYVTIVSRWVGVQRILSKAKHDTSPLHSITDERFVWRFEVSDDVWLPIELGLSVKNPEIWANLTFLKDHLPTDGGWGAYFRKSMREFSEADGAFLVSLLKQQEQEKKQYPLTQWELNSFTRPIVNVSQGQLAVTIPTEQEETPVEPKQSHQVQASIAKLGLEMGYSIWIPPNDKTSIEAIVGRHPEFITKLPLNYDEATLRTFEHIDVIWIKGRSIARAFEVEHTTAIYSGLLRMADLLALQPNMDIRLHIVAPDDRAGKVLDEISRPVFSLLEGRPLKERCSLLTYTSIEKVMSLPHLSHLKPEILDEYAQEAE